MLQKLLDLLRKPADPSESQFPLVQSAPTQIAFEDLTKGIDNIHIDVTLSPTFIEQAKRVATSLMDAQVGRGRSGERSIGPTPGEWEEFRASYAQMVEAAVHRAKRIGQIPVLQLVQVAALKMLARLVQEEIEQRRQLLKSAIASVNDPTDARKAQFNERMAWMAKNRVKVRFDLCRQLYGQVAKAEAGSIGDVRQSLLGARWSIPQEAFLNPLLQAENPLDDQILMGEYVLLGQGPDDPFSFAAVDNFMPTLFQHRTPVHASEIALANAQREHAELVRELDRLRRKREAARSADTGGGESAQEDLDYRINLANEALESARAEYYKESYAWADAAENVDTLFNYELYKQKLKEERENKNKEAAARLRGHIKLQKRLLDIVERRLAEASLLRSVIASYEMLPLYSEYSAVLNAQQLHQVLAGAPSTKEILRRLKDMQLGSSKSLRESLRVAARQVASMPSRKRKEHLLRFLKHFVGLRRDLSTYFVVRNAMNRIQLQEDPKNIRLSRANYTLYEYLSPKEEGAAKQAVLNLVILKADVRGSTKVVAELRNRGLNPASHFSLKFFEPINDLLKTYGAGKVFIEGDAVILSIFEQEGPGEHHLGVARACGLARRLLSVVQAENAASRKVGLPELELGIGLVFSAEPPAFLYDGDSQIMISSAIGKADRLSSCSWMLRQKRGERTSALVNVEVCEIPEGDPLRGEKGEHHLRYNVNGVELDAVAFVKLKGEITMHRLQIRLPGEDHTTPFYAGSFPDVKGNIHHLVIREGKIRLFDRQDPNFGKPTADVFYEVVTNEVLVKKVSEAVKIATDR